MRNLSLSLIVVVLASIVSLGWLLNKIYDHSDPSDDTFYQHEQLQFITSLALSLDTHEQQQEFIKNWNSRSVHPIQVLSREDLPLPSSLENKLLKNQPILLESENGLEAYILLPSSEDILSFSLPSPQKERKKNRLELLLTLSFYAGITTIILIWVWPLIHHLEILRQAALRFGQGSLSTRAKVGRLSYIKDIEQEFNRMADKIESLISDNKLLSRAVSHDLKTPLARLRFGLDALSETENPILKEKYANRVDRDLEDMESLIETLLQYARLDDAQVTLQEKEINLPNLIHSIIQRQDTSRIAISSEYENDDVTLVADPRYLTMLINNIVSNGVRHANQYIHISVKTDAHTLIITIEDDGPGIPASDRTEAIKPFWRAESSRDNKGHGMGLAIVARIAEWHNATLAIDQSHTLGGAQISLHFSCA